MTIKNKIFPLDHELCLIEMTLKWSIVEVIHSALVRDNLVEEMLKKKRKNRILHNVHCW